MVFLHGFTEDPSERPFAGWRALAKQPVVDKTKLKPAALAKLETLERLRTGKDSTDTAPVRDVALDQAEAQLEESGQKQLVMILPQGGLQSQFGSFDPGKYVAEIVRRL